MKIVLLVLCAVFCAYNSFSQRQFIMWPTEGNTDKIVFSETVYRLNTSVTVLHANAIKFANNNFKGEKDTIVVDNSAKTISGKSAFFIPVNELGERGKGFVSFSFQIWSHNNYYKYRLADFQHVGLHAGSIAGGALENEKAASDQMLFPRTYWNELKAKSYYRIQTTIENLKLAMAAEVHVP